MTDDVEATRRTRPLSTYRLQLHSDFRFDDARAVVDYLDELGITHLYLSPVVASVSGSRHGYDVVDPTRVDPELGGREGLVALAAAAHERGLGVVLDIVPNHLAATPDNPWWSEMLRDGPDAAHAPAFDVDWSSGRIILPVLDRPLDEAIATGAVSVGGGAVHVGTLRLPVRGDDTTGDVREVLDRQFYELADWGEPRRNYRRFFDVDSLVGVRVEEPVVFEDRHALLLDLVHTGVADGLRVDHIDGLRDPHGYLRRLRERTGTDVSIFVEKILTGEERLRRDWPIEGTTGYDAMTDLDDLLVDPAGWDKLAASNAAESIPRFGEINRDAKRFVLTDLFTPELSRLVRDHRELEHAVVELTIALPVYRTYLDDAGEHDADRFVLQAAAGATAGAAAGEVGELVELLLSDTDIDFTMRWQQLTGPVMAKGHEDTALYRDAVLVSRNDVGGDPGRHPDGALDRFQRHNVERSRDWPRTMVTTSTHDTKRSEDVRARIAVLSELAGEFEDGLVRLRRHVRMDALSAVEQRLIAQTLLGILPATDAPDEELHDRLHGYFEKALREAKVSTSWTHPDEQHEAAARAVVEACLADGGAALRAAFGALIDRVAYHGALNSLTLTVLKLAGPGVADTYQGTELLDLSLVDPDNRRPVEYRRRRDALASLRETPLADLKHRWSDGRLKLVVLSRALHARRDHPDLFVGGDYVPIRAPDDRIVAFARHHGDDWAVAIASRFTTRGTPRGSVALPPGAPPRWRDALTGSAIDTPHGELSLSDALSELPVALLLARR
jgi:(1->4)-alpha-D-glucan 1-alpha-D-glucosylmutase